MKQLLWLFAIIVTGCLACKDGLKADLKAEQKIISDTANFTTVKWIDSSVNFGTVKMGEKIQIKFRCQNVGLKPLIIVSVRPGCGCTVASYTKEPIAVGDKGLVTAEFDTNKSHGGEVTKYIIVTTNTKIPDTNILFTGEVTGGTSNDKIAIPHEPNMPKPLNKS